MAAKKIEIIYDINGKAIDVAVQSTLNLKQQVRELTKEVNKTKEGTEEFRLLSAKLNETRDNMERVKAKSGELFNTLSLLPGPVGEFGGKIDGSINLLKTFSGFKLSDLSNQFKELTKDAGEIIKNILGLNAAEKQNVVATEEQVSATEQLAAAKEQLAAVEEQLAEAQAASTVSAEEQAVALAAEAKAAEELVLVNQKLTATQAELTAATEVETVATEGAEVATIGFGTALKAIGIGLFIAAIATLIAYWDKIKDAITGATEETKRYEEAGKKAAEKSGEQITQLEILTKQIKSGTLTQREKNQAVNDYNDKLGDTLGKVKSYAELEAKMIKDGPDYIQYLKTKSIAEAAYQLALEKGKDALKKGMESATSNAGWQDYLSGWLESKDFSKTLRVQGEVNRDAAVAELNKDKDAYMAIFNDAEGKANQLADKLKIKVPEIKYTGDTKNVKENQNKQLIEKEKEFQNQLTAVQIDGEKQRANAELEAQYQKDKREIEGLNISKDKEDLRQQALLELKKIYDKKKQESDKKFDDEALKAVQEFNKKIDEIHTSAIKDDVERTIRVRQDKLKNDLSDLEKDKEFIKKSEDEKTQILKDLTTAAENDINKIKLDAKVKGYQDELTLLEAQQKTLQAGTQAYTDNSIAIENKAYEIKLANAKDNAKQIEAINTEHAQNLKNIDLAAFEAKKQIEIQKYGVVAGIGASLQQLAGKNKELAIGGIVIEKASAIGQIWANNAVANAKAVAAAPLVFGQPWVTINTVAAALSTAATIAAAAKSISEINGQSGDAGGSPTAAPTPSLKQGYADGGMIEGPRHAAGGVMINAEGGEAIMTRGAVTMFAPLLSTLNQMGGGTSFASGAAGQAKYDNPRTQGNVMEPQVIKTYVVENELTTVQHKQARLKDLSTL
jgi:hypothetical protein